MIITYADGKLVGWGRRELCCLRAPAYGAVTSGVFANPVNQCNVLNAIARIGTKREFASRISEPRATLENLIIVGTPVK